MSSEKGAIMFWIRPDDSSSNDHDIIELYENRYTDFLLIRLSRDKLYVVIEDDNTALAVLSGTHTFRQNEWAHVALVQDGHALRLYVNGTLDALESGENADIWTAHLNLTGLRLGAGSWGDYIGDLDDVIFTDWAPTPRQIYNLVDK